MITTQLYYQLINEGMPSELKDAKDWKSPNTLFFMRTKFIRTSSLTLPQKLRAFYMLKWGQMDNCSLSEPQKKDLMFLKLNAKDGFQHCS